MRIAVVATSYPHFPGDPSGHFIEAEAHLLAQCGAQVVVVHPEGVDAFGWPGVAARVRARPWRAVGAAAWVMRAQREVAGFDRVIAHWAVPCAWPIAIGARGANGAVDAELEVVSHGGDVRLLVALPGIARNALVARIATRATTWRFVSAALLADLVAALPMRIARRVEAIARVEACAIAMPDVSGAIDARRRDLKGERVAVCVARLVASKRVDAAIAHAARAGRALVVVGDGPERGRLEAIAEKTPGARVRFVGRVNREEALAWIGAADEVLHASRAEGASTVLREAALLGVPVTYVM